jgi:DNA-directed RNA polymerase specialized sigma24 family protein
MSAETARPDPAEDGHRFSATYRRVRRILTKRGVRGHDVPDRVQDVMAELQRNRCPVNGQPLTEVFGCTERHSKCRGKALLHRIAWCDGVDQVRQYSHAHEVQFPEDAPDLPDSRTGELFDLIDSPSLPLLIEDLHALLKSELTERERSVVLMTVNDGMTVREIAKKLEVSVGTVSGDWHKALDKLRMGFGEAD